MSENESFKEHENESTVNEGTEAKATLQQRALKYLPKYPQKQTLKAYAEWLCWDLHVSVRTAFDSYIMPLFRREYFKYVGISPSNGKSIYVFFNPNNELIDTSQLKANQEIKEEKPQVQPKIEKKYENYIQSLEKGAKKLSFDEFKGRL
jgi:hypothetical protein